MNIAQVIIHGGERGMIYQNVMLSDMKFKFQVTKDKDGICLLWIGDVIEPIIIDHVVEIEVSIGADR